MNTLIFVNSKDKASLIKALANLILEGFPEENEFIEVDKDTIVQYEIDKNLNYKDIQDYINHEG